MSVPNSLNRALLGALVFLALALPASGCTVGPEPGQPASASSWSYTDDAGKTVTLDHAPSRVAGFTDQILSLMSYGIAPVAVFGRTDVASDTRFAGYDLSKVKVAGNTYGEIDLEALATAQPDLIVTAIYPTDRKGTLDPTQPAYGLKDIEQQKKLEAIAPIITVKVGGDGLEVIKSNTKLALALGADQAKVDQAKRAFDTASANLTEVALARNLKVAAMYADADGIYLVKPKDEPETQLYSTLGVDYLDLHPDGHYYWDIFSWENAGQVKSADVILLSNEGYQKDELHKQPTFSANAALTSGQVYERRVSPLDYGSQAKNLEVLAGQLEQSRKVA